MLMVVMPSRFAGQGSRSPALVQAAREARLRKAKKIFGIKIAKIDHS
jgi:hypothetical protein